MSLDRRLKRKRKKEKTKDLKEKLGLFDKTPNQCNNCERPFDKKDREQVSSWRIVVREKQEAVNLYCPSCWSRAVKLLESIGQDLEGLNNV